MANICPNIAFSVTGLILLWKFGYPAFPWSAHALDNITQCTAQSIFCAQFTPIVSQFFPPLTLITMNDHYYPDPYRNMPRCHLWVTSMSLGKYIYTKKVDGKVRGIGNGKVLLGQHAVQTWTPLDSDGTSWGQLFVPESPSPPSAWCLSDCGRWVECYTTTAWSAAHIQYEAAARGCCCGVWWIYPLLML